MAKVTDSYYPLLPGGNAPLPTYLKEVRGDVTYECYTNNAYRLVVRTYTEGSMVVKMKAFGRWEDRESLDYTPIWNPFDQTKVADPKAPIYADTIEVRFPYVEGDQAVTVFMAPPGAHWDVDAESLPEWLTLNKYTSIAPEEIIIATCSKNYGLTRNFGVKFLLHDPNVKGPAQDVHDSETY